MGEKECFLIVKGSARWGLMNLFVFLCLDLLMCI